MSEDVPLQRFDAEVVDEEEVQAAAHLARRAIAYPDRARLSERVFLAGVTELFNTYRQNAGRATFTITKNTWMRVVVAESAPRYNPYDDVEEPGWLDDDTFRRGVDKTLRDRPTYHGMPSPGEFIRTCRECREEQEKARRYVEARRAAALPPPPPPDPDEALSEQMAHDEMIERLRQELRVRFGARAEPRRQAADEAQRLRAAANDPQHLADVLGRLYAGRTAPRKTGT